MVPTIAFLLVLITAATAHAQSTYVGGALIGDIQRFSGSTGAGNSANGETFGGALRVGAPLGDRWGVDLEFVRSGELEAQPDVRILANQGFFFTSGLTDPIPTDVAIARAPQIATRQQLSTLTAALWWRHEVSERFDLVYLGGVAFSRVHREARIEFPPFLIPLPVGGVTRPAIIFEDEAISYDAGVSVGLDARIGVTEHLRLVPGARLLTVSPGGIVVRPAVALHWLF